MPDGSAGGSPRPDLVLGGLAQADRRRVLAEIERGAALRELPPVVLSGYALRQDRIASCELAANACVAKPAQLGQCQAMVRAICEVGCGAARSPLRP